MMSVPDAPGLRLEAIVKLAVPLPAAPRWSCRYPIGVRSVTELQPTLSRRRRFRLPRWPGGLMAPGALNDVAQFALPAAPNVDSAHDVKSSVFCPWESVINSRTTFCPLQGERNEQPHTPTSGWEIDVVLPEA